MNIVVYVYNSFNDPLFQGNLMMFIRKSRTEVDAPVYHVITHEQKEYELSPEQARLCQMELEKEGIFWYPLKWHSLRFGLFLKFYDLVRGGMLVCRLRFSCPAKWIITLGSVSASFGFIISRLLGMKQYAYQFEPHSEFLLDMGLMKRKQVSYILLNWIERLTGRNAEIISTGTDAMISRLMQNDAKGDLYKIPSAVDEEKFVYREKLRKNVRDNLGIQKRKVIIYVGKTGGVYYSDELFTLFRVIKEKVADVFFIVLTPQPRDYYVDMFQKNGINADTYHILLASHDEVPGYLSAADLGIVAIPSRSAQKYRSPIKVGEYLLCGLPYLTCEGVSEDDVVARQFKAGVVVTGFSNEEINAGIHEIAAVLHEDKSTMVRRCRQAGLEYRGFSKYYKTYAAVLSTMADKI